MSTATARADILRKAVDILESDGWIRGADHSWNPATGKEEHCLRGALVCAANQLRSEFVGECLCEINYQLRLENLYRNVDSNPICWNDRIDRTASEVIGILLSTAERIDPQGALVTEPKPVIDDDGDDDDEDEDGVMVSEKELVTV